MGSFVGKDRNEVYTPEVVAKIDSDPLRFAAPPGGDEPAESQFDVEQRMMTFVNNEVLKLGKPEQTVVVAVFCHNMAIRCFLRGILEASETFPTHCDIHNTGVVELVYNASHKGDSCHNLAGW